MDDMKLYPTARNGEHWPYSRFAAKNDRRCVWAGFGFISRAVRSLKSEWVLTRGVIANSVMPSEYRLLNKPVFFDEVEVFSRLLV